MVDILDTDYSEPADPGPNDDDRARALAAIQGLDRTWHAPSAALSFDGLRWLPHLERKNKCVLHLELTGEISHALERRLRAAHVAEYELTVALGTQNLNVETLLLLQKLDARLLTFGDEDRFRKVFRHRSVADWVASARFAVTPNDFARLANERFDMALSGPVSTKGRHFEETLCFVFNQVSWLTVDKHAYRNASEEIDLLLGIHAIGHAAELAKGAVAVATAKNENKATSSATVKYLKEQMANRKGRCTLGFLCSATNISDNAKSEILRGSQSADHVIVQLDGTQIQMLIDDAVHIDERMEKLITEAVAD